MWIAQSRFFAALPNVRHGFFGRIGGVSEGLYASLNAGLGSGDDADHALENRQRIAAALGALQGLVTLRQVHSATVLEVTAPLAEEARPEGDAIVTTQPGLAIGALTADCVPVLFADAEAGVIGAAHAGWKGAKADIMATTLALMEQKGAKRSRILTAIGPCIAQPSYEVGAELRAAFVDERATDAVFFADGTPGKYQFDLGGLVESRLSSEGLAQVERLPLDTYPLASRFYSFRRATHRSETDYGRQVSAIALVAPQ